MAVDWEDRPSGFREAEADRPVSLPASSAGEFSLYFLFPTSVFFFSSCSCSILRAFLILFQFSSVGLFSGFTVVPAPVPHSSKLLPSFDVLPQTFNPQQCFCESFVMIPHLPAFCRFHVSPCSFLLLFLANNHLLKSAFLKNLCAAFLSVAPQTFSSCFSVNFRASVLVFPTSPNFLPCFV